MSGSSGPRASGGPGQQGSGGRGRGAGAPGRAGRLRLPHQRAYDRGVAGNTALRAACEDAFLSVPDGMPLGWILRRRGATAHGEGDGHRVHAAGSRSGGSISACDTSSSGGRRGRRRRGQGPRAPRPGGQVVGAASPPFGDATEWGPTNCEACSARTKPHVLWVGLGAPKQELWMAMVGELERARDGRGRSGVRLPRRDETAAPARSWHAGSRMAFPAGRSRGGSGAGTSWATRRSSGCSPENAVGMPRITLEAASGTIGDGARSR